MNIGHWLRRAQLDSLHRKALARQREYAEPLTPEERQAWQLKAWNAEWQRILKDVPYYAKLARERSLPESFRSWEEFLELIPVTTRGHVQEEVATRTSQTRKPDFYRMTGGTTAQPIQMPAWRSELVEQTWVDLWAGRLWFGLRPSSRQFMLWGHSHLLGTGLKGWLKARRQEISDWSLGWYRFSAYDLRKEKMRQAARRMIEFKPEFFLGYSVALDHFARANRDMRNKLRKLHLKVVIGAAEAFPFPDSEDLLRDLFDSPVTMEYGAVETNLIAQRDPSGIFRVFWRSYFVEATDEGHGPAALKVRVTSLYPRCFPLVRYELGDEIEPLEKGRATSLSIDRFRRVLGRCNDYIELEDGAIVHSEAFTHAVRTNPLVRGYQIVQEGSDITVYVVLAEPSAPKATSVIQTALAKIHPALERARIEVVSQLTRTVAGKTPMIIKK